MTSEAYNGEVTRLGWLVRVGAEGLFYQQGSKSCFPSPSGAGGKMTISMGGQEMRVKLAFCLHSGSTWVRVPCLQIVFQEPGVLFMFFFFILEM
jgi:hypothetical protein